MVMPRHIQRFLLNTKEISFHLNRMLCDRALWNYYMQLTIDMTNSLNAVPLHIWFISIWNLNIRNN